MPRSGGAEATLQFRTFQQPILSKAFRTERRTDSDRLQSWLGGRKAQAHVVRGPIPLRIAQGEPQCLSKSGSPRVPEEESNVRPVLKGHLIQPPSMDATEACPRREGLAGEPRSAIDRAIDTLACYAGPSSAKARLPIPLTEGERASMCRTRSASSPSALRLSPKKVTTRSSSTGSKISVQRARISL